MKLRLNLTVFTAGAIVMTFELLAVRLLAPYYGTSIVVWTSIIGVILASLSVGNFLGGVAADRYPTLNALSNLIALAAGFLSLSALFADRILSTVELAYPNPEIGSLIATVIICTPASIFLAMIPPFAVRLSVSELSSSGATSGRLFALSSAGSILGTFLAGFYLIPLAGTAKLLAILGATLFILAALCSRAWSTILALLILAAILLLKQFGCLECHQTAALIDIDTRYSRVEIKEHQDFNSTRRVRSIFFDPFAWQGAIYLDRIPSEGPVPADWRFSDDFLVIPYTRYFRMANAFVPEAKRILVIGGCIMSVPQDLLRRFPQSLIDVVEIDRQLIEIAREHFGYEDSPRITLHFADGRSFINRSSEKYDLIIVDAFTSAFSVPFQLTTREAAQKLRNLLSPQGVVMFNTIGAIEGSAGKFIRAEYRTFKTAFDQVELFPVNNPIKGDTVQNVILVASSAAELSIPDSADSELHRYYSARWAKEIKLDQEVLTDDFAPVEYLSLEAIKKGAKFRI